MDKKRGDNCQESGVPGVTAEKPQTVLIHYYRGYLNIIEVVGFLFRYRQFLFQCVSVHGFMLLNCIIVHA